MFTIKDRWCIDRTYVGREQKPLSFSAYHIGEVYEDAGKK